MDSGNYLIGIDCGTTGTKVILFGAGGKIVASSYSPYPLDIRKADIVEQNPDDWWNALVKGVRDVSKGVKDRQKIRALSISTQGATIVPLDKNKKPLSAAITWLDKRAGKQSDQLVNRFGQKYFFRRTGHQMQDWTVLAKIIKWKRVPKFYRKIFRLVQVNDYLMYRLTGKWISDPSNAAMSSMFGVRKNSWDNELLDNVDIDNGTLSPIKPSGMPIGSLLSSVRRELGFDKDTLVVNGGHDQYCAALGAGVIDEGDCLLSCGTAWVVLCPTKKRIFDPLMRITTGVCVVDNRYGLMAPIPGGNIIFDRVRNIIGVSDEMLKQGKIEQEINKRLREKNSLVFLPHFLKKSGGFIGLDLSSDKYDLLLAVMKALVFETKCMMEIFESLSINPRKIVMIGGGAKSKIWPRIAANILGNEIVVLKSPESACRGAAMLAGLGSGIFKNTQDACRKMIKVRKTIKPTPNSEYQDEFVRYRLLSKTVERKLSN